ncbi:MAG: hypothetical protein LBJ20_00345 [Candidatus Methanoplasma sp.]|jgi:hypothetical protein|nr:hypothetical protein [Candidatus Methanoplasma sp.]
MSFFDDNRKVGLALIIVGILNAVVPIMNIVHVFIDHESVGNAIGPIGALIFGLLILSLGFRVRSWSNDRVGILSELVRVIGVATILIAVFKAISNFVTGDVGIASSIVTILSGVIIGLILLWISAKIKGKSKNILSKFLWALLVIVFLALSIITIVSLVSGLLDKAWLDALMSLCNIFVYVYAFLASISSEVRHSMNT